MRRLLWIGDAACPSGFARCTHHTVEELRKTWDVHVLGLNYRGDPHRYPYPIYPAALGRSDDLFGLRRVPELIHKLRPDVAIVQNDPWNLPMYMELLRNVPTIAALAVDGLNCQGRLLNGLTSSIFWTHFGAEQAAKGGYKGPYGVVPLGVDQTVYNPIEKEEARERFFRPEDLDRLKDAFIVANVNRNQPRKRLDLTISYFCQWVREQKIEDAYLWLHVAPTGDLGYDCHQLMSHYGFAHRLILSSPEVWVGVEEHTLNANYNIADVGFTTTQGEGWGLTTMEMMACSIPQIVPDWAALGEWTEDAAVKIRCSEIACTINNINVIGGIMDRRDGINALDAMYRDKKWRQSVGKQGFDLVSRPEFRWPAIGQRFADAIEESIDVVGVQVKG
jgi:D-inositol-3-phosphate glycosyltransferase